jgi:hypothetical protein
MENFMLTDQDKARLRAEEAFRVELDKKSNPGNKFWQFLNSSLGIWFLSIVG